MTLHEVSGVHSTMEAERGGMGGREAALLIKVYNLLSMSVT